MKNIIYGLRDPRNDVYQYIGKSTVGEERPLKHLTKSHSERVNKWVKQLEENWQYPIVDIIEEVENIDELSNREKYWIDYYYGLNPELLNIQSVPSSLQHFRTEEDEEKFNFLCNVIHDIPKILKKERMYRKLTQEELAKEMKVARSTISCCENDRNVNLRIVQDYIRTLKGIDILRKAHGQRVRNP